MGVQAPLRAQKEKLLTWENIPDWELFRFPSTLPFPEYSPVSQVLAQEIVILLSWGVIVPRARKRPYAFMLGRSHVVSGLAGASLILTLTDLSDRPEVAATTVALVAGSSILPDVDHPGTTISRSLPPVTRTLSRVVSAVSGGHRKGTHAIIGWLAFGLLALLLSSWQWTVPALSLGPFNVPSGTVFPGLGLLAGFLAGIALTALDLDPGGIPGWLVAVVMGGVSATANIDPFVVGVLVTTGCAIHVVFGDGLTPKGVRYLYPFINTRFWFPILGKAGSQREIMYVTVLGMVAVIAPLFEHIVVPWIQTF